MNTSDADSFFLSSIIYYVALALPIIVIIFVIVIFSRGRAKSWQKKTYLLAVAIITLALIGGALAFTSLLQSN